LGQHDLGRALPRGLELIVAFAGLPADSKTFPSLRFRAGRRNALCDSARLGSLSFVRTSCASAARQLNGTLCRFVCNATVIPAPTAWRSCARISFTGGLRWQISFACAMTIEHFPMERNSTMKSQLLHFRRGLTLMELIVVMVILVALAALIIPRMTGITGQAGSASSAAILQGISEAEARYESQFSGQIPSAWDGVLNSSGAMYTKLHPKILSGVLDTAGAAGTTLVPQALTAMQAQSLTDAGMTGLHFQDEAWTGAPSDSGRIFQSVASGTTMMFMNVGSIALFDGGAFDTAGGHNVLFSDRAFSIQPFTPMWANNFVVVGFGNEANLKRNAVQDTPLFVSANPSKYYARGLLVFMVPPASVTTTTSTSYFKAKYVGCFAPDGTCLMDNLNGFNQSQTPQ
jgi:prepilin-type N-terminal cleavage/methylation domain-containing protein